MEKIIKLTFLSLLAMSLIVLAVCPVSAAEPVTELAGAVTDFAETEKAPDGKAEVEEQIKDAVNKTDEVLSGNVWWESAKTWIIENLSTVSGFVMAVAAVFAAIFAKVGIIPQAINAVKSYGNNCQNSFSEILNTMNTTKKETEAFIESAEAVISDIKAEADENKKLREELEESRQKVIELCQRQSNTEKAMAESAVLVADAMEQIVEISSIAQTRKDAIFTRLEKAKTRIESELLEGEEA